MARISLRFLRSARAFCKETTAQIAAGSQPISVTCRIRQSIPVRIRPLSMKDKNGRRIAMSVMQQRSQIYPCLLAHWDEWNKTPVKTPPTPAKPPQSPGPPPLIPISASCSPRSPYFYICLRCSAIIASSCRKFSTSNIRWCFLLCNSSTAPLKAKAFR